MQLSCVKENGAGETRVALVPADVKKLAQLGFAVSIEQGAGAAAGFADSEYAAAGATISGDRAALLRAARVLWQVQPLTVGEVALLPKGALTVSFLDPFRRRELIQQFSVSGVSAVSLEMVPRSTLAQKMDALSSQNNLAGYAAVVCAAEKLDRVFPMMMTPAGTLTAAKVLIVGVGVAGLQAIATAKRLGARVTAFDTRPVVEEQVRSLGAKFLKIELGETGQTAQGYAKELTAEQIALQQQGMAKACADSDVVITTAQVFGRPAPRIINAAMLAGMRAGSLVLDLAVTTGGNVEGADAEREVVTSSGARIIGCANFATRVPHHASQMFSSNLLAFITHFWDKEAKRVKLDADDEIMRGCLLVRDGEVAHQALKKN
ncbi:MAG: NAD(P) transhydrogenase subunit alpha [Verrucomicrobiales bacterium]|jgi:NAD(P) transhydrogenase subunit alpha|nr:NAD(P) transhydrogenase subunit alpha [Verrucomicrobiales bacterium]